MGKAILGQLERVTALSILLGVCIAIKTWESLSGMDMSWVDPLFGTVSGGWLVAVNVKRGGIGEESSGEGAGGGR